MSFFQPFEADVRPRHSRWGSILFIILVAVVALGPELATGLTVSDSYRFNLLWPEQFGELFRSGDLYPRWLPRSWEGMGSPVFYFYPPLFFWVAALVDTLFAGALPPERFVPLASLIVLAASGIGMRAWLTAHVSEPRASLGAIAYMLAPYHLYDIYGRGALAEATAYASVPLVMLGLAKLGENRTQFLPLVALGYGALLVSHLPTALLASLFLIPPYVAFIAARSARRVRLVCLSLAGGLFGIAIAAVYLIPALALLRYVSPEALSGSFYQPESWFYWHLQVGPVGAPRMFLIIPASLAALMFAAAAVLATRSARPRSDLLFWAGLTALLVLLIAGAVPFVWKLPGLSLVQFPWRALVLVEFTTVTMLAIRAPSLRNIGAAAGLLFLAFAYWVLLLMAGHTLGRTLSGQVRTAAEIRSKYWDAPEYLPAGTRIVQGGGPDDVKFEVPKLPVASATERNAKIAVSSASDGGMTLDVNSPLPTMLILRRYYFPRWRALDASGQSLPIKPVRGTRVVSFRAPEGHSVIRLTAGTVPYEALGRAVSVLALLSLTAFAAMSRRTRRPKLARR